MATPKARKGIVGIPGTSAISTRIPAAMARGLRFPKICEPKCSLSVMSPPGGLFAEVTLNSLAKGGETAVGKAVSPTFTIKGSDQSLLIEWHGGRSEKVDGKDSLSVRLVDARSGKVLKATSSVPGSPAFALGQIPLEGMENRTVRLEVLDIDKRNAYAWIGLKSVRIKSNK